MSKKFKRKMIVTLASVLLAASPAFGGSQQDMERGFKELEAGNLMTAMRLLREAAETGYAPAQARLGYILDQSEEDTEAVAWFRKAADQGNAEGAYRLGKMYTKGEGVERDPVEAGKWMLLAAENGYLLAMRAMGYAFEKADMGVSKDLDKSVEWFTRAAESGDSVAMKRIAQAYRKGGLGLTPDTVKATLWDSRAAATETQE